MPVRLAKPYGGDVYGFHFAHVAGCGGTGVGGGFNCPHVATHDDGHQA